MTGFLVRAMPVVVLLLAIPAQAQTQKQPQRFPPFDPERIFMLGDADLDGRLSQDEYRDFLRSSPRMRDTAPATIDSMFRRLDADRDGFLSLKEYRNSFPQRQRPGGAAAKSGAPKETPPGTAPGAGITPEQEQFFEAKIRPVFVTQCGKCHSSSAAKLRGGLHLDSREGLRRGGDSGPAIVPGRPDESLLIRAIRYSDEDLQMPPKGKLPDAVVADFEAWIRMGAPDARTEPARAPAGRSSTDLAKARDFWSFRPPKKFPPPLVKKTDWPRCDIDRFLLAALEAKGLAPVADAGRPRLLRRLTFDLSGFRRRRRSSMRSSRTIRPAPSRRSSIGSSPRPASASGGAGTGSTWPATPSRAARRISTIPRPGAIGTGRSPHSTPTSLTTGSSASRSPATSSPPATTASGPSRSIATGFLALGSKAHDAENRGQFILDVVDEQIEATTRAFLGLTVACARCHDHKIDPILQRDYYALSGIFRSTQTCSGTLAGVFPNFNASPLIELPPGANVPAAVPALTPEQRATMEQRLAGLVRERNAIPPGEANRDRLRRANSMLATLRHRLLIDRPGGSPRAFAMGVRERDECVDSPLYVRGELDQPGQVVPRGLVRVALRRFVRIDRIGQRPSRAGGLARLALESADRPA